MNNGYQPPKSESEFKSIELKQKLIKSFLKGGSKRFEDVCPETIVMMAYLNNKTRSVKDIEKDLIENDEICLNIRTKMKRYGLSPEENPDFDLREIGITQGICTTFREICEQGNALYIELILTQFSFYVEKLNKLNYDKLDDFLEDMILREKDKSA